MVAIVTGGSKGIGYAIARALLARDLDVVISARNDKELTDATRSLGGGTRVHGVRSDVRSAAECTHLVSEAVSRFGGLDVLVNNAGVGRFANVADMSDEEWQQVIETNLSGVFRCCRAAIPEMRRRGGGFIINISSLAGKNSFAGAGAYCASKAGLNAFSEALMQEVRYDNIRVAYVMPGSVSTGFGDRPSTGLGATLSESKGRGLGGEADWKLSPDDVARVVVDLISHDTRSLPSRVEIRPSRPPRKG